MAVFAVIYTYVEDSVVRRDDHRPAHRAFLDALPNLLASGPWASDPAGALLIAEGPDLESIERDFDPDPFNVEGLVAHREIHEWTQGKGPWV
jgi:uncharacterized protein YciI